MYQRIITLDGIDKTGKDTIKDAVVAQSGGRILVIARSYISQIAYSRIFNRQIDEGFFIDAMCDDFGNGRLFFYLIADDSVIASRFDIKNEIDINKSDIALHKKIFGEVVDELRRAVEIITIDTSEDSINDIVQKIVSISIGNRDG